tara:strand:- start:255 stop:644 length:390 start_codon:yes stop_codon:yes gene_type:complete
MPKFYGQNKRRKDPRYFLNETEEKVNEVGMSITQGLSQAQQGGMESVYARDEEHRRERIEDLKGRISDLDMRELTADEKEFLHGMRAELSRLLGAEAMQGKQWPAVSDEDPLADLVHFDPTDLTETKKE